jgi:NADPH:quinone reductase
MTRMNHDSLPTTRRAVAFEQFGGPEALKTMDLPMPAPGEGEVLVRVQAATVNPTDQLMLAGAQVAMMRDVVPPYVAGMEFAGLVAEVGAGVTGLRVGQPVMGVVNPRRNGGGAHAEYMRVPAVSLAVLGEGVDPVQAATVPMNGLTARMCLELLGLPAGASLLVTGAAGAVGGFVIQMARSAGLHVIADAKDADSEWVRRLGAHEVVPRGEAFVAAVRARCPAGVDGLVDAALLGDVAAALVRDGGGMVSLRGSQKVSDARVRHAHVSVLQQAGNTEALRWLADRLQEGALTPRVAHRVPMAEAARAFELLRQGGLRGRVVLEFGDR